VIVCEIRFFNSLFIIFEMNSLNESMTFDIDG